MKRLILSIFTVLVLISCSSDDDSPTIINEDIFITFKVDGTTYNMEPYTAGSLKVVVGADEGINDSFRSITLSMPTGFTADSHQIIDSYDLDDYTASYSNGDVSIDGTSGTLVITSISNDFIEGTFSFTGEDQDGTIYNVTEGSFRAYNL